MKYLPALSLLVFSAVIATILSEPTKEQMEKYQGIMKKNCEKRGTSDKYDQCVKDIKSDYSGKEMTKECQTSIKSVCEEVKEDKFDLVKCLLEKIEKKVGSGSKLDEALDKSDKGIDNCVAENA